MRACTLPAEQAAQEDAPVDAEYWPRGQFKQLGAPGGANLPLVHAMQMPALLGVEPGAQGEPQPMFPEKEEAEPGVPSGQAAQEELPVVAEKSEGGHGVQVSRPGPEL